VARTGNQSPLQTLEPFHVDVLELAPNVISKAVAKSSARHTFSKTSRNACVAVAIGEPDQDDWPSLYISTVPVMWSLW